MKFVRFSLALVLAWLLPFPFAAAEGRGFSDVPEKAWYAEAVIWCQENGLTDSGTVFSPETVMTRSMVASALYRASGRPDTASEIRFTDVTASRADRAAIAWAAETGVIAGYGDDRFGPEQPVTRQQFAAVLWRYAGKPDAERGQDYEDETQIASYAVTAVDWARDTGVILGKSGNRFDPYGGCTRAQAAVILHRYLTSEDISDREESSMTVSPASALDAPALLYMGQASIRIVTPENCVIYIDPYAGDAYDLPADLILVTHGHFDHCAVEKVENRNAGCAVITHQEAVRNGVHQTFEFPFVTVEAVEAGYNRWHDVRECVGYVLTFSNGKSVYVTGDTSTTKQMPLLAEKGIDYAFFCCDGVYNMGLKEAAKCAGMVGAKHNIPYHNSTSNSWEMFDRELAEQFEAENRLIVLPGKEISIT